MLKKLYHAKKQFLDRWAHQHRHRPPLEHHPGSGFDPGDGPRPDRRARPAQRVAGPGRAVRQSVRHPVQPGSWGIVFTRIGMDKALVNISARHVGRALHFFNAMV
jgi:hypothetical protein